MIRETWVFWILLFGFIFNIISAFRDANGYKKKVTWDAPLSDRLVGIVLSIIIAIIYAIALGWL